MSELKNFEQTFNSKWAGKLKQLLENAIEYKKQMSENGYSDSNLKEKDFEQELSILFKADTFSTNKKEKAFVKLKIKEQ